MSILRIHQLLSAIGERIFGLLYELDPAAGEFTSFGFKYSVANLHA